MIQTLADCLKSFATQLRLRIKQQTSTGNVVRIANGIEHACEYVEQNYEKWIEVHKLYKVLPEKDRIRIRDGISKILEGGVKYCQSITDEIIDNLVTQKANCLQKHCEAIAANGENQKKTFVCCNGVNRWRSYKSFRNFT